MLAYTTTVGLEAAVRGVPVAAAGATHYRGRGFTVDVGDRAMLERFLAAPPAMTAAQHDLARRYALTFFFRSMVPMRTAQARDAAALAPGTDPYLED